MTARRRRLTPNDFVQPNAMDEVVTADQMGVADQLGRILESLRSFDESTIIGYLYRKPPASMPGKFGFCERIPPPFEYGPILDYTKERFGGGEYRLQIFAGGKTRGNFEFTILGPSKPLPGEAQPATPDTMNGTNLIALMMSQAAEARRDAAEDRRAMMEQQRDQSNAMWAAIAAIAPVAIPLLIGNREKMSDIIALMNSSKPEGSNIKDTAETFLVLKKVFGNDQPEGFNPDDIAGSIGRLAGPMLAGVGRAFNAGRGGAPPADQAADPYAGAELQLPPPAAPGAAPAATPPAGPQNRVLALIRPHVLYFYTAQLGPDLAADAIVDIMVRAGVGEADLNDLVGAFAISPDWKADLAAQGLDLRGYPEWADDFLAELVDAWTNRVGHGEPQSGGAGGMADAPDDAETSASGLVLDDGEAARA